MRQGNKVFIMNARDRTLYYNTKSYLIIDKKKKLHREINER